MNFDDYEQLPTPSTATNVSDIWIHVNCVPNSTVFHYICYCFQMIAGGAAGILEHCVMYPVDSIKVSILMHTHQNKEWKENNKQKHVLQFWNCTMCTIKTNHQRSTVRSVDLVFVSVRNNCELFFCAKSIPRINFITTMSMSISINFSFNNESL